MEDQSENLDDSVFKSETKKNTNHVKLAAPVSCIAAFN